MIVEPTITLTPAQLAQARQHGYTLLSQLVLQGVTPEIRPYLAALAPLQAALTQRDEDAGRAATLLLADADAAAHHALWQYDLAPYASVFLDPAGQLEGPVTEAAQALYGSLGFWSPTPADHLGHELAYLAHLCQAEAAAHPTPAAQQLQAHQAYFLRHALLPWLPPLVVALQEQPDPFYTALGSFIWEWVAAHLADWPAATPVQPLADGQLPTAPAWEDPQTTLGNIADWLTTPPYAGFYLGRRTIGRLAQTHSLPCGFGGRRLMLLNLLRSAGRYDAIIALWEALLQLAQTHHDAYLRLAASHPHLTPWLDPWVARAHDTLTHLRTLRAQTAAALAAGQL